MKSLFTFCLIVLFFSSYSQEPGFKLYTTKEGLVGNEVWGIKQDAKGFLWLATTDGVSRFDGLKFKNFTKNNGLTHSFVSRIDISGDTVFILGRNVIDIIVNDSVIKYYEGNKIRINEFMHIEGRLYAYCENINDKKNLILDLTKRRFVKDFNEVLSAGKNNKLFYTNTAVYKVINSKLYKLNKNYTAKDPVISKFPEIDKVRNIVVTSNGDTYVFIKKNGKKDEITDKLILLNKAGDIKKSYDLFAIKKNGEFHGVESISDHFIILIDLKGYIYLLIDSIPYKINFNFYNCNKILKDNEGNIWVATNRGLVKIFYKGFLNFPASSGYPEYVWGVFPENNKKTWFASYSSGLHCYENGILTKTISKLDDVVLIPYYSASKGFNNDLFIPEARGVIVYDIQNHSFKLKYKNKDKACMFTVVDGVDKKILVGLMTDLFTVNKDYSLDSICSIKNFGSNKVILAATRRDNNYYLACSGDILEFNITSKKGKWFNLKNARFNSIATDYNNNLWAASDEGIYFFSSTDTLRFFSTENFMALIIDKKNCLFAVTNKGLYRLDLASFYKNKKVDFEFYGEDEGFSGAGDQNAFFMDDEGNLWIPGGENCIKIIPSQLETKKFKLQPFIQTATASDNESGLISLLKSETNTLNYNFKNIHFDFLAICLSSPEKVKYQYRLVGYNDSWSSPSDKREASYTNLSSGDYTFELRASANNNFDKAPIAKLLFTITPPFWQTWWFYTISFIVSAAIVIFIFRWQMKRIKKHARDKQEKVQLRLDLLQQQLNPHFIDNCLNSVNYLVSTNDEIKVNQYLSDFSRLMRLTLNNSHVEYIPLSDELELIQKYLQLEYTNNSDKFEYKIIVDDLINTDEIEVPPSLVQPFIENAIKHAFPNYIDRMGKITIEFKSGNNGAVNCTISDNGIGIEQSKKDKTVTQKQKKSKGESIVKERLALYNTVNKTDYKIEIIDLHTNTLETGTTVIIEIPKKQKGE
jgi:two-component sensor histidine kinase